MSKKSLHLLLLLISWTVLSGQTPGLNLALKDSSRCYYPSELKVIALKLISGTECDTLLKIARLTIITQDTAIKSQAKIIEKQDIRYVEAEHLISLSNNEKEVLRKDLKKTKSRLTWTKVGWVATTVLLTITTILALVK